MTNFEKVLAEKDKWVGGFAKGQEIGGIRYQHPIYDIYIKDEKFCVDVGNGNTPIACLLKWYDGRLEENTFAFPMPYRGSVVLYKTKGAAP